MQTDTTMLIPALATQLATLTEAEQALVAEVLLRARANAAPEQRLDALSLIHPYFKADPVFSANLYKEIEQARLKKAPWPVKAYPQAETVVLPRNWEPLQMPLDEVLLERHSDHNFSLEPMSLQRLSTFLHYTYGIKRYANAYNTKRFPVRFTPSAGGLQPVDLYLVVSNVEGVRKGLYYYDPVEHALKMLDEGNLRRHLVRCCLFEEWIGHAPVVLILVCNMQRVLWKYSDRSYRFVHVDTGVLTGTMYLVGTALDLVTCAVAGYFDDMLNNLLQLDGHTEFVSLVFVIGDKPFRPGAKEQQ